MSNLQHVKLQHVKLTACQTYSMSNVQHVKLQNVKLTACFTDHIQEAMLLYLSTQLQL